MKLKDILELIKRGIDVLFILTVEEFYDYPLAIIEPYECFSDNEIEWIEKEFDRLEKSH